jgi:hypothetical protein
MKKSAFASLCQVSAPMVSKYIAANRLVMDGDEVDAEASLAALSGILDEGKRLTAISTLAAMSSGGPAAPLPVAAPITKPSAPLAPTAKQSREEWDAKLKQVAYMKEVGELVSVSEVQEQAYQAVAAAREVFANGKRKVATEICLKFGISAEREPAVVRALNDLFEAVMGRFSEVCTSMATADSTGGVPVVGSMPAEQESLPL